MRAFQGSCRCASAGRWLCQAAAAGRRRCWQPVAPHISAISNSRLSRWTSEADYRVGRRQGDSPQDDDAGRGQPAPLHAGRAAGGLTGSGTMGCWPTATVLTWASRGLLPHPQSARPVVRISASSIRRSCAALWRACSFPDHAWSDDPRVPPGESMNSIPTHARCRATRRRRPGSFAPPTAGAHATARRHRANIVHRCRRCHRLRPGGALTQHRAGRPTGAARPP
jgi:hypothetical protein